MLFLVVKAITLPKGENAPKCTISNEKFQAPPSLGRGHPLPDADSNPLPRSRAWVDWNCRTGHWRTSKKTGLDIAGLDIDGLDNGGPDIDGLDIAGLDIDGRFWTIDYNILTQ